MGYCKPCQCAYVKARKKKVRLDLRRVVVDAKDRPCMDCGQKHPSWAMDFDHRDPSQKKFTIAKLGSIASIGALLEEIAKCDVVCALCHRYRTHGQRRHGPVVQR